MFVNLTPHTVTILDENNKVVKSLESKGVARAEVEQQLIGEIDGIEIVKMEFGAPTGLPDPEDGVKYIVSLTTAQACDAAGLKTDDLYLTSNTVRDKDGKITGCRYLAKY